MTTTPDFILTIETADPASSDWGMYDTVRTAAVKVINTLPKRITNPSDRRATVTVLTHVARVTEDRWNQLSELDRLNLYGGLLRASLALVEASFVSILTTEVA